MNDRGEITSISFDDLFLRQESGRALVFDARLPLFYRLGHIPGAINMPLHKCNERINEMENEIKSALAEGKIIVTYCSGTTCPDARSLAQHFSERGYPVSVFSGGWDSWSAINEGSP